MATPRCNSLVGITDYDEGTNLSCYLMNHGWNTDHALSAEEVLEDLEDGNYALVVLDEELLSDSQWTLQEYLDEIGPEVSVLVLTEPGSHLAQENPNGCAFLQHPYTNDSLRWALDRMTAELNLGSETDEEEEYSYDDCQDPDNDGNYDWEGLEEMVG